MEDTRGSSKASLLYLEQVFISWLWLRVRLSFLEKLTLKSYWWRISSSQQGWGLR